MKGIKDVNWRGPILMGNHVQKHCSNLHLMRLFSCIFDKIGIARYQFVGILTMSVAFGVKLFLTQFGTLLEAKKVVFKPRNRNKTISFLLDHGLTAIDALEICSMLEECHYHSGPENDRDGSIGQVMVFVYPHEDLGLDLYIKLKIWTNPDTGERGAVLSFHEEGKHECLR